MDVSFERHCCLADFGIRLRTLLFGIFASDEMDGKDGDNGTNDDETLGRESVGTHIGGLGGFPGPVHREDNGPWTLNKPEVVVARDLRQTEQTLRSGGRGIM